MRRALASIVPKLAQQPVSEFAALHACKQHLPMGLVQEKEQQRPVDVYSFTRSFASDALATTKAGDVATASQVSLSPTNKITYNELNHARFAPGTEGRSYAYLVQTGGRFLYASALRLALLKVVVSLSAAADTLAMGSLEVDISGVQEGETITVKWRGKPVFIKHRTDEEIAQQAATPMSDLKDPQKDADRTVDPKYLIVVGICTHLGCVPIGGAGNYGGWFCPCHGSHYDGSGRVREGPAPYNLEVPEYTFLEEGKLRIG